MVKSEDDKWFHQWMETIVCELKEQRVELAHQKDSCGKCREEVIEKVNKIDKQMAMLIIKVGALIAGITFVAAIFGEYVFKYLLSKAL